MQKLAGSPELVVANPVRARRHSTIGTLVTRTFQRKLGLPAFPSVPRGTGLAATDGCSSAANAVVRPEEDALVETTLSVGSAGAA